MALSEEEELELLELEEAEAKGQSKPNLREQIAEVTKGAVRSANPVTATKAFFETDPANMQRKAGVTLPIFGGIAGGPVGAALGELARQATGTALAPETVPETAVGRAASVIGAGVAQDPKILAAIPGVPQAAQAIGKVAAKTGRGLAKAAQVVSGGRAGDFVEAAKRGYETYLAPSVEKAGEVYARGLGKLPKDGGPAPSLSETMKTAVEPEAATANKYLTDLASRMDQGELPTAMQALKAKQAIDDVIDVVPVWQTKRRAKLFDLKRTFDEILSNQSGEMKAASETYRAAKLKDAMTKWLPVNKHGEYSRLAPMLSSLLGTATGMGDRDVKKGVAAGAGYLLATSPLAFGSIATTGGQAFGTLASNPAVRQALLQVLSQIMRNKKADGSK